MVHERHRLHLDRDDGERGMTDKADWCIVDGYTFRGSVIRLRYEHEYRRMATGEQIQVVWYFEWPITHEQLNLVGELILLKTAISAKYETWEQFLMAQYQAMGSAEP